MIFSIHFLLMVMRNVSLNVACVPQVLIRSPSMPRVGLQDIQDCLLSGVYSFGNSKLYVCACVCVLFILLIFNTCNFFTNSLVID